MISIQVNTDILLTEVKCISHVNGKACNSVELMDVMTRKTIFKQTVIHEHQKQDNEDNGVVSSLSLNPSLLLPKGFAGLIVSHYDSSVDDRHYLCTDMSLDVNDYLNGTGLISILKVKRCLSFFLRVSHSVS